MNLSSLRVAVLAVAFFMAAQSFGQVTARQTDGTMPGTSVVQATTGPGGVVLNHTVSFTFHNNTQTQQWVSIRVEITRSETGQAVTNASSQQVALQPGETKVVERTVQTTHSDSGTSTNAVRGKAMSSGTEVSPALWSFVLNVTSSGGAEIPVPQE